MNFENFNFHPDIMSGIRASGYTVPTPIQTRSIPPIMNGQDIIGMAQTGTGKTAAFVLPTLQRLLNGPRGRVRALIISPTRELVEQTCEVINKLGSKTGMRSTAIYGGISMEQQIRNLRKDTEIAVACPGRLLDHIWKSTIDLSHIEILIIDEADRMLDMGFLPDIRNIIKCLINKHQTLLFSATMPADIRNLIKEITHDPVTVQIGQSAPANTVSHAIYPVAHQMKTELLIELLKQIETESVLVFTRTKHSTERITRQLQRKGFKVASLQGNLSQNRRQYALDGFRRGSFKILVATDLAARGIDISTISHVINYDMPESIDAYIHRIGRTGRVDKNGDALTFVTPSDTVMIRSLERILKTKLERRTVRDFKYSIPDINSDVKKSRPRFRPQRRRFPNREKKNNRVQSAAIA